MSNKIYIKITANKRSRQSTLDLVLDSLKSIDEVSAAKGFLGGFSTKDTVIRRNYQNERQYERVDH